MGKQQSAEEILNRDLIKNYCVLEMLKASKKHDIDILNESVFIRLKDNGRFIMLSAPDENDGNTLLKENLTAEDKDFYTIGFWPSLIEGKDVKYRSECVQLYLPEYVRIPDDTEDVITLGCEMAPYVHERYDHKDVMSVDYIRDRIRIGPALGVMDNGVLAGWVMTHEEGTMGVLTVLPEYRRKGYAQKLNAALVKSLREQGKPCIVHIIKGNTPSLTLAAKSGMVYSCDVHWIFVK